MFAAHNYLACNPHRARSFYLALACVLPNVKWCHLSWQTFFHGSGSQSPNIRMELGRFHMLSTRPGPTSQGYGQQAQKNMAPFQGHSGAMALTSDERNTVCLDITVQMSSFCSGGLLPRLVQSDQIRNRWPSGEASGVALGNIHRHFAWQAWHQPSFCVAGVALWALGGLWLAHWHVSPCLIGSDAGMFRMFRFGPRTWEAHWHKCHARHAKRRLMSPSATPAMQSAASLATNGPQARHQSQPSRTSAMPAMQKEGWCRQVPRLPRKVPRRHGPPTGPKCATRASPVAQVLRLPCKKKVDVAKCHACHAKCRGVTGHQRAPSHANCRASRATNGPRLPRKVTVDVAKSTPATQRCVDVAKCHACHAKWWWMSPSGSKLRVSKLFVTKLVWAVVREQVVCDKVVCVWASCVWQCGVWQSCVWASCVSGKVVWLCVCEQVVCDKVVCVTIVCDKVVCERWCVTKLCVCACVWTSCVCVWEAKLCGCVCVIKLCVWQSCMWQSCVWQSMYVTSCVWASCVGQNCVRQSCLWASCVCDKVVVCEQVVCWKREEAKLCVCVTKWCVSKCCVKESVWQSCVCVSKLCVKERRRRRRRRRRWRRNGIQNQKQEPHTKMWGIYKNIASNSPKL